MVLMRFMIPTVGLLSYLTTLGVNAGASRADDRRRILRKWLTPRQFAVLLIRLRGQFAAVLLEGVGQGVVTDCEDARGEQTGVGRAVDRGCGDRYAPGHLGDREQGVQAVELRERDRDTDDRQRRHRGQHAGQVRRTAGAGDQYLQSARTSTEPVLDHGLGRAVRRHDVRLAGDAEALEDRFGALHDLVGRGTAHDDPNEWLHYVSRVPVPYARALSHAVTCAACTSSPTTVT